MAFTGECECALPGDTIVFLTSANAHNGCEGAAFNQDRQGGVLPRSRRVTVTLPSIGYYGLCTSSVRPAPSLRPCPTSE